MTESAIQPGDTVREKSSDLQGIVVSLGGSNCRVDFGVDYGVVEIASFAIVKLNGSVQT